MAPEIWLRIPGWLDAKRSELEKRLSQWPDLNDLIREVLVAEHHGIDTAADLPDQATALRMLLSEELRRDCPSAQGKADSDFYTHVSPRPINDIDRRSQTSLKFISQYMTELQKLSAIRTMTPRELISS